MEIVVRAFDDDNDFCGTIQSAEVQFDHGDDTPYFAIDCHLDEPNEPNEPEVSTPMSTPTCKQPDPSNPRAICGQPLPCPVHSPDTATSTELPKPTETPPITQPAFVRGRSAPSQEPPRTAVRRKIR